MSESNGFKARRRGARLCLWLALAAGAPAALHVADASAASESSPGVSWMGAYNKSEWGLAVALIEAIPERSRTPVQWLYLARARERLSRLVEAVDAYERARELSSSATSTALSREVRRKADEEAAAVARRIPWADIVVSTDVPLGAYVFVDDAWLPPARLRSPYPVNPGWHTFLLEVDGEVLAARRVYFAESQQRPVRLAPKRDHGAAQPASSEASPRGPAVFVPHRVARARPSGPAPRSAPESGLRAASYFTLGAGALGLLMGAGFTIRSAKLQGDREDVQDQCDRGFCGASEGRLAFDLEQQSHTSSQIAKVSFVLGGLSAATGALFYYLSSGDEPKRNERAGVQALIGLGSAGLAGRF